MHTDYPNLIRELAFLKPISEELPINLITVIMKYMNFSESLQLAIIFKEQDQPLNPMNWKYLNPLQCSIRVPTKKSLSTAKDLS